MARIVVNKHSDIKSDITIDSFINKGEIIISNEVGNEGIFIKNTSGTPVFISAKSAPIIDNHVVLTQSQYDKITRGEEGVDINGNSIMYDENTYYAIVEEE
jgi:hypothetical protein